MQLSAILGHPDQSHFPHPPSPSFTRKDAASRVEETVNYLVKETEPKPLEKNTDIETNVTEWIAAIFGKNHAINRNKDINHDIQPIQVTVSFQCDQCEFKGVSDKGLTQHTRMKHKVTRSSLLPYDEEDEEDEEDEDSI